MNEHRTAVIFGLANKRSIAWAIAQKLHQAGWQLAITYQNERLELEAKDLIAEMPGAAGFMCDVTKDDEIARLFEKLKSRYGVLHGLVHSVAYAPKEALEGEFLNTTREAFAVAHDVTVCYGIPAPPWERRKPWAMVFPAKHRLCYKI